MNPEAYKSINGIPVLTVCSEENLRSAMQYEPQSGDVLLVTYPKCGTTWTQYIVCNILTRDNTPVGPADYSLFSPFIDMMGAEAARNTERGGPLMTHLPLNSMVFSERAKYIYVTRNPYDCCVSCYHFLKHAPVKMSRAVSFGDFVEYFISGKINYGDFFDHLLPWYGIRDSPNVLFLTYEDLRSDTKERILKIADFLGEEHGTLLRKDSALLARILESSSLENMRRVFNYTPHDRVKALARLPPERTCRSFQVSNEADLAEYVQHKESLLARKGIMGDWKNHFSPEQILTMKAWIDRKTKGTDVLNLWKGCCLP